MVEATSWIEISRKALLSNLNAFRAIMTPSCALLVVVKANAYGHGAEIVAQHLVGLGYDTLCVAHVAEAVALADAGVQATFLILSATLPEHADTIVAYDLEPVLCTGDMADALSSAAENAGKSVSVHLMVDTGMGRIGIRPEEALAFLERCRELPVLRVRGLMSHMPRADEADKVFSRSQIKSFQNIVGIAVTSDRRLLLVADGSVRVLRLETLDD